MAEAADKPGVVDLAHRIFIGFLGFRLFFVGHGLGGCGVLLYCTGQGGKQFSVLSGQFSVVSGQWSVVSGRWSVVNGRWPVVSCQWPVAGGQLSVVSGRWFVGLTACKARSGGNPMTCGASKRRRRSRIC